VKKVLNIRYSLIIILIIALAAGGCSKDGETDTNTGPDSDRAPNPSVTSSGTDYEGKAYTFKVAHEYHPNSIGGKIWEKLDETLQYYTDGRVKLEIYPFSSLYTGLEQFTAVSTKAIDIAGLSDYVPQLWGYTDWQIGYVPFFFGETMLDAYEHDRRFQEHPDGLNLWLNSSPAA